MLLFIFKSCFKKVDWCWKRVKKFHAYNGTNGSLFRLWLRLLHVMLDVILIICLVVFAVARLVSNDWDCLMCLWKNHALFLLYGSILLWYSPSMLYLGWPGACSHHVWLQTSCLKPLWSFGFWLVIPIYALVNNVLPLCMIMTVIALLVGRSQSFASLYLYWEGILLVHPTPKNQSFPMCPPYLPIRNFLFQVHSSCFYLSSKLNFLLCEN
jgi:hypothetical protein